MRFDHAFHSVRELLEMPRHELDALIAGMRDLPAATEGDSMASITEHVFDTERFGELITRYSGTLSQIIRDSARKGIRRHREDLLYLERWGVDETEISADRIGSITSQKNQQIARLQEQLELADLLQQIDLAGFAAGVTEYLKRARQES